MLDTMTLRIAFTAVALMVFALLGITLASGSRSSYAAWWCVSLLLFLSGDALFLADGTGAQFLTNPTGDALVVAGAATTWCGARSLRSRTPRPWQVLLGPVLALVAAAVSHPGSDAWAGGPVFLGATAVYFGLCCREMWLAGLAAGARMLDRTYEMLVMCLAVAFGLLTVFYAGRCVAIVSWGSTSPRFERWFGSASTTLGQLLLLVVVAFTMSSLISEQKVRELQKQASRDALTGLLNRTEFTRLAVDRLREVREQGLSCVLVMADLDLFKSINDTFGHPVGDRVLQCFGRACADALRSRDLVARYGGEEFVLLLTDVAPSDAERVTARITARYQANVSLPGVVPTVSYGLAPLEAGVRLQQLIERADAALYRAKAAGRDRVAYHRG